MLDINQCVTVFYVTIVVVLIVRIYLDASVLVDFPKHLLDFVSCFCTSFASFNSTFVFLSSASMLLHLFASLSSFDFAKCISAIFSSHFLASSLFANTKSICNSHTEIAPVFQLSIIVFLLIEPAVHNPQGVHHVYWDG